MTDLLLCVTRNPTLEVDKRRYLFYRANFYNYVDCVYLFIYYSALPKDKNDWFTHLCEENRLSMIEKRSKSGRKSNTKCPSNRSQTKSVHIVPLTEEMHFCL